MKTAHGILGLFTFLIGIHAHAATGSYACTNGDIDKMGDQFYQIDILEDGISFSPYEGNFTLDASDISYSGETFTIVNKVITATAEGEESSSVINAILILDEKARTLNAAISRDHGPFQSFEMNCEKN